jgi:hypothetical protein
MTQYLSDIFGLGLPSDVLPCPSLPVNDASKCSSSQCNNNSCCFNKRFARWSRRRSTQLSLKHIIAAVTCWLLVVAFCNRTFFLLSLTPPKTFKFYSSVCNILVGIHLSWCVDGLNPNPVFCQSSRGRSFVSHETTQYLALLLKLCNDTHMKLFKRVHTIHSLCLLKRSFIFLLFMIK